MSIEEALNNLFEDPNEVDELSCWFPLHPSQLLESLVGEESEGVGDQ